MPTWLIALTVATTALRLGSSVGQRARAEDRAPRALDGRPDSSVES